MVVCLVSLCVSPELDRMGIDGCLAYLCLVHFVLDCYVMLLVFVWEKH